MQELFLEWPCENPRPLDRGGVRALSQALWDQLAKTGFIDGNVAEDAHRVELFAFRFSRCLDKRGSLFLVRPEPAEPQG